MKFKTERKSIHVYHENDHKIGEIVYDSVWSKWILRAKSCGLDEHDLNRIRKFMRRLK